MTSFDPKEWKDKLLLHLRNYATSHVDEHFDEAFKMVEEMDPLQFVAGCEVVRPHVAIKFARRCEQEPELIPTLIDLIKKTAARSPSVDEALDLLAGVPGEEAEAARLALSEGTPLVAIPHVTFKKLQSVVDDASLEELQDIITAAVIETKSQPEPAAPVTVDSERGHIHIHIHGG